MPPTVLDSMNFLLLVSNVDIASYKLVRFLSQSLTHWTCNNIYIVKSSYDFLDNLKLNSSFNYSMLYLDVKSFFINVLILERRYMNFLLFCWNQENFEISLCIRQRAFIFNSILYSEVYCVKIESLPSLPFCDIYMHYFNEKLFSEY